jgi:hypothetical protein
MTCRYEKNLPNGSATICTLDHTNCIAVDTELSQEDCELFQSTEEEA